MVIFENYGIVITFFDGRYYLKYDDGWITIKYEEFEVSKEEAEMAQRGEDEAYELIIRYQNTKQG